MGEDRRERHDEAIDVELARKRPLPVPRLDETDRLEHAERVAHRSAADAEPLREVALARQRTSGGIRAVEHQHADAVGDLFGKPRLADRNDEAASACPDCLDRRPRR